MIPAELQTLVDNFHDQMESYKSPSYNETQLRRDFLDKFIKILGWDVENEKAYHESFREVIHEDRIRIAGQTKAPDYSVQSNGGRLFYIEAKKPSVNIHDDPAPAFQIRRYGWTAKMPVCLLTNFHFFILSKKSDKAAHDELVSLVDQMLVLKKKEQAETVPQTKTIIGRQIQVADKQIDALVYQLYGLTEEDIKIVEGKDEKR